MKPNSFHRWGSPALISLISVAFALVHMIWKTMAVDSTTVFLLILAILPWLAPIIGSIELPGGWKIEFQKLQERIDEATGAAQSASMKADAAFIGEPALTPSHQQGPGDEREPPGALLDRLSQAYNLIRETQVSSPTRTASMAAIFRQMCSIAPSLHNFPVKEALQNVDNGRRLAGYAYLYSRPDIAYLPDLVQSVSDLDKTGFGQYWGIVTIDRVLGNRKIRDIDATSANGMQKLLRSLPRGSDRHYELSRILKSRA